MTESLLERELRRAMDREAIESLPLYPEGRKCRRPTARRLIDLFDDVQRHSLRVGRAPPVVFTTQLSRLQRRLLRLLGMTEGLRRLTQRPMPPPFGSVIELISAGDDYTTAVPR